MLTPDHTGASDRSPLTFTRLVSELVFGGAYIPRRSRLRGQSGNPYANAPGVDVAPLIIDVHLPEFDDSDTE